MYSIETTLNKQLDNTTQYLTSSQDTDGTAFLGSLSSLWNSSNSHQVIILTTQLLIHEHVRKCLEVNRSLEMRVECIDKILSDLKHLQSVVYRIIDGCNHLNSTMLSEMLTNRITGIHSTLPDSTDAIKASESNLTSGSGHINDMQQVVFEDQGSVTNTSDQRARNNRRKTLLDGVITIIISYIEELNSLMNSPELSVTNWESTVHYKYSADDKMCSLNGAGVSIPYGVRFTGNLPIVSSLQLEDITKHMILTMNNNCSGLVCTNKVNLLFLLLFFLLLLFCCYSLVNLVLI